VEPHETPTRLRQGAAFYGVPLAVLPWLVAGAALAVAAFQLAGAWVALLVADRWGALGLRLALAMAAAAPVVLMTAPGLVFGHSVPRFVVLAVRSLATPRLTLWRPVAPCEPVPPAAGPARPNRDAWGADREDW
jgi:hypothetical protein